MIQWQVDHIIMINKMIIIMINNQDMKKVKYFNKNQRLFMINKNHKK